MTPEQIIVGARKFQWYHAIELTPGFFTESNMQASFPQWEQVRKVRASLDYRGKSVLDIGTMDGMWAFEAEKLGANFVAGADIWQEAPDGAARFAFARSALNSCVEPLVDCDVQQLSARLMYHDWDIIQCLGMLYHVENPILALREIRKCLQHSGAMLLETAVWPEGDKPIARFNTDEGVYCDKTTFWAPNMPCLRGMLELTGFKIVEDSVSIIEDRIHRVALVALPK